METGRRSVAGQRKTVLFWETAISSRAEGLRDDSYAEGPRGLPNSLNKLGMIDSTSVLCTEASPLGMGCMEICPAISLRPIFRKSPPPFFFLLERKQAVMQTCQNRCSVLTFNLLLLVAAKMYPLFHRSASRKAHYSPKPVFDPLSVDPLAMVMVDDMEDSGDLKEGELVFDMLE
ncbi:hypothetical protein AMTR_s00100p00068290 [Amborella trichopoda]|uniref:Uncharacterized protein n=1 Tax=Amborella trichopoda TaxID=13333 RepID=W1NYF6_AMBTC|nr:hypothetical protein AMTR_s00100p00068290 [Amborella trichopoda]